MVLKSASDNAWGGRFGFIVALYLSFLMLANMVGDRHVTLLHFTVSLGTLFYQLGICTLVILTQIDTQRRLMKLLWLSASLFFMECIFIFCILEEPVPHFWADQTAALDIFREVQMALVFPLGFIMQAIAIIVTATKLHQYAVKGLWLRLGTLLGMSWLYDVVFSYCFLTYFSHDVDSAMWKVLSFVSVKIMLVLLSFPLCYYGVRLTEYERVA